MEFLAKRALELSDGNLEVQIFPSEQLGNEKECIEALQLGYLAMTKTSTGPMEAFVPRIRIFGIPYLFRDGEHFWKVALGPIGRDLLVAPVISPRRRSRHVYLPDDRWIHLWSGKTCRPGWQRVPAALGEPPVFYREASPFARDFTALRKL